LLFLEVKYGQQGNLQDFKTERPCVRKTEYVDYKYVRKMIPVIREATGTISKSFRKYLGNTVGKHDVKELQKTATLGTAHILREVLL
jgi:hypothetical protein